jgi:hypothetical protein
MTSNEFENIITANPSLTTHGFGVDEGTDQDFDNERTKLADCFNEVLVCEEFLSLCKRTVNPHKALGSTYHFKHAVERYAQKQGRCLYIPEGALLVAALHLGFKMMPKEGTTSVYLNISKKTKIHDTWIDCY